MVFQEQNRLQLTMAMACIRQSRNMALLRMMMKSVLAPYFVVITFQANVVVNF